MNIFSQEPNSWVDLQNKVALILNGCGYEVQTPKKIKSVRTEIEVDVYARNDDQLIVCECKYWESNICQNTVLAFRTVINDIGANKGIIIAKRGFQKGAYNCITNTNIELKTWDEFLQTYKEAFLKTVIKNLMRLRSKIFRLASDKQEYWKYYDALTPEQQNIACNLRNRLLKISIHLSPVFGMLQYEDNEDIGWHIEYLDQIIKRAEKDFSVEISSYHEYFSYLVNQVYAIVTRIETLYGIEILRYSQIEIYNVSWIEKSIEKKADSN